MSLWKIHSEKEQFPSGWLQAFYEEPDQEAEEFQSKHEDNIQIMFIQWQHHWHELNEREARVLQERLSQKSDSGRTRQAQERLVCHGVAAELDLKCSGRHKICWERCWVAADVLGSVEHQLCWPHSSAPLPMYKPITGCRSPSARTMQTVQGRKVCRQLGLGRCYS